MVTAPVPMAFCWLAALGVRTLTLPPSEPEAEPSPIVRLPKVLAVAVLLLRERRPGPLTVRLGVLAPLTGPVKVAALRKVSVRLPVTVILPGVVRPVGLKV